MHSVKFLSAFLDSAWDGIPITTTWEYFSEDPWCVYATFDYGQKKVPTWEIARDLLVAGLVAREWVGEGDVQVMREYRTDTDTDGEDQVLLRLFGVVIQVPVIDLSRFLAATILESPLGDELMPSPDVPVMERKTESIEMRWF